MTGGRRRFGPRAKREMVAGLLAATTRVSGGGFASARSRATSTAPALSLPAFVGRDAQQPAADVARD
jgi:hypothetical protein